MNFSFTNSLNFSVEIETLNCPPMFVAGTKNGLRTTNGASCEGNNKLKPIALTGESTERAMKIIPLGYDNCAIRNGGSTPESPRSSHPDGRGKSHLCRLFVEKLPGETSPTTKLQEFNRFSLSQSESGRHLQSCSSAIMTSGDSASTEESFLTISFNMAFDCSGCLCIKRAAFSLTGVNSESLKSVIRKKSLVRSITSSGAESKKIENEKCGYGFVSGRISTQSKHPHKTKLGIAIQKNATFAHLYFAPWLMSESRKAKAPEISPRNNKGIETIASV